MKLSDGGHGRLGVDVFHAPAELRDAAGGDPGDLPDAVLVTQQVVSAGVEDLPCRVPRLGQDLPAVAGVGVVAEVGALVHESLAVPVQHDPERIAVLLEAVADGQVSEFGAL